MSTIDPYDFVLRDLRQQRDKIDAAIVAIESVRGISSRPELLGLSHSPHLVEAPSLPIPASQVESAALAPTNHALPYVGMTIYEAAINALRAKGEVMANSAVTDAIQAGGLKLNAADPYNTVGSVLTRRFFDHGDVVRVGRGTWGLPEWFPDRDHRAEAIEKRAVKEASIDALGPAKSEADASKPPLQEAGAAIERWRLETAKLSHN